MKSENTSLEAARIDALEARVAHQDRTIEELNLTVTAQWKEIERLTVLVSRLDDRVGDISDTLPAPSVERPPHY